MRHRSSADPPSPKTWTFAEAIELAGHESDHIALLTGNGLSVGASTHFGGDALSQSVLRQHMGPHAQNLIYAEHPTQPEDALRYFAQLDPPQMFDFNAAQEYEKLQGAIIQAIAENHPSNPDKVGKSSLRHLESFLYQFDSIFTTNYDLLQYWAINQREIPRFQDGFSWQSDPDRSFRQRLVFAPDEENQDPFFWHLHGGLHIYKDGVYTAKRKYEIEIGSLKRQALSDLRAGKPPLVVVEGTRSAKEDKMRYEPYLTAAFEALEYLSGSVFTYGWGFNEQDYHIVDTLFANRNIQTIWVGIWKGHSDVHNLKLYARINERLKCLGEADNGPMIEFYSTESAQLWAQKPVIIRRCDS